jgi:hypothetical protein
MPSAIWFSNGADASGLFRSGWASNGLATSEASWLGHKDTGGR